jgi:hypothetical protein
MDDAPPHGAREAKRLVSSNRGLPDLRQSVSISDGGSICLSKSLKAKRFSVQRSGNHRNVSETYISSLIDDLQTSLKTLEAYPSLPKLEEWATLIHECLSCESRKFHSVHHVFEISAGCEPLQLLAAFFRDSINCATDGEVVARQKQYVGDILNAQSDYLTATNDDRLVNLIMDIFGLQAEQSVVEYAGLDVFLSAILMARVLQGTLSETYLAQIAVCMEATIPFRPRSLDNLYKRLEIANKKYELDLTEEDLVDVIQRAADLNNRNLGNFASEDAVFFLDHTWSLLPERSKALRSSYLYSVNDICTACRDMEIFLTRLDATLVFQSFKGVPNQEEIQFFQQRLDSNLEKGRKYMRAKLLSVAVCSAIATLTGGDGPMSFFIGDLPTLNYHSDRLGEGFPTFDYKELTNGCDNDVYLILNRGLEQEQSFDTSNSPIAAYLYAALGDEGVLKSLQVCEFPMTPQSSKALLTQLPQRNVQLIAADTGKIALSRTEAIQDLLVELFGKEEDVVTS